MIHVICFPSDENVNGPEDAITVGPFDSERAADAWVAEFKKVRPGSLCDVLVTLTTPADALLLFAGE